MKILISGAGGFIGSHLLRSLGSSIEAWAILRGPAPSESPANVRWIREDLASTAALSSLSGRCDAVVHLAQSSHFREFPEKAADIFNVNVAGTFRLLEWARNAGVSRFIYASSGGIYGYGSKGFREEDLLRPQGPLGGYLASKRCGELLTETYAGIFKHVVIARPFFVYGTGQKPGMLIPRLVRQVAEGRPLQLQGRDGLRVNPIHVDDVVRSLKAMLRLSGSHIVNLAGPEVLTLRQIGEVIARRLNRPALFEVEKGARPRHLIGDISRMKALLGAPRVRFDSGVAELCREAAGEHAASG